MSVSLVMCWTTILAELVILPFCLLIPRLRVSGIWIGILFHSVALWLAETDFGAFYGGVLISYLAFINWPKNVLVKFDLKNDFHFRLLGLSSAFEFDKLFRWLPYEEEATNRGLVLEYEGRTFAGFCGTKKTCFFFILQRTSYLLSFLLLRESHFFIVTLVSLHQ